MKSRDEAEVVARSMAQDIVTNLRENNGDYAKRTGEPSKVSEADYLRCEDELVAKAMKLWEATH